DMGALLLVAVDESLFRHDLKQLEDGGVLLRGPAQHDGLMNFADGGRSATPEDGENFELRVGGPGRIVRHHVRGSYYDEFRMSSGEEKSSSQRPQKKRKEIS